MDSGPALIELPSEPGAVSVARQFVSEHGSSLDLDLIEDAELLVSELVTNAITHGKPAIVLRVRLLPSGIGVEVRDEGPEDPVMTIIQHAHNQRSGRGLGMVAAVASAWGVRRPETGPGKIVWFTLGPGIESPLSLPLVLPPLK